ncbi:MAG: GIY-YIG nuclease family protein [Dehalococcoidia bacterium]
MTDALPPGHWLRTAALHTPAAIRANPCPVPASRGIYAWFFRDLFPGIQPADRLTRDGHTLLYVGIAGSTPTSTRTLRKRLTTHCNENAYRSTLRYSLGALLVDDLGLRPTFPYKQQRPIFEGETRLSEWLKDNARIAWHETPQPREAERQLIAALDLPLNLEGNHRHPFHPTLTAARKALGRPARPQ